MIEGSEGAVSDSKQAKEISKKIGFPVLIKAAGGGGGKGMKIVKDEKEEIKKILLNWCNDKNVDVILATGGTGLTGRDTTPEAVNAIASKHIDGFGELFRHVSFEKIGTSAIQSRAVAALINSTYVFCLPGSTGACKDGWDEILQYQLDIRHKPCNFVEIMPRLNEK